MNKIDNNTILDKYKEISKLNIEEIYMISYKKRTYYPHTNY